MFRDRWIQKCNLLCPSLLNSGTYLFFLLSPQKYVYIFLFYEKIALKFAEYAKFSIKMVHCIFMEDEEKKGVRTQCVFIALDFSFWEVT